MDETLGGYLRRLASDPGNPLRPALVVQGGGLRGIYSLSALAVLEEQGLRDAFSRVIGSSAGAINGAYFLAGQAGESLSIYTEDLSNKRFVNPWRFWKIVDVDYMIDVLREKHHLDEEAMRKAPATLYTVLTDAKTAETRIVSSREPGLDVYEVFRATAALPGLYNKKIEIEPGAARYVDGGVSDLLPLDRALDRALGQGRAGEEGQPDEAVVLLTRGWGHEKAERGRLVRGIVHLLWWWSQSRPVREKVCRGDGLYNQVMKELEREDERTPRQTWTLCPSDLRRLVKRTTTDRERLLACAKMAREDTLALLAQESAAFALA
ncbi:MAG TPA: patatin-like phospholipase family protein [Solirubrobacterales bacterium]|nr:patatin-like phospholipase family protein [Solirubrobacterales bacterium]